MTEQPPLILAPEDDPIETLLSIATFTDGSRGLCEIYADSDGPPVSAYRILGMAALGAQPEKDPVPIFEHDTRAVRVCLLADWLEEHGLSPGGARWHRKPRGLNWLGTTDPKSVRWELIVKAPALPALPPETDPNLAGALNAQSAVSQYVAQRYAGGLTDPDPAPIRGLADPIAKGR